MTSYCISTISSRCSTKADKWKRTHFITGYVISFLRNKTLQCIEKENANIDVKHDNHVVICSPGNDILLNVYDLQVNRDGGDCSFDFSLLISLTCFVILRHLTNYLYNSFPKYVMWQICDVFLHVKKAS